MRKIANQSVDFKAFEPVWKNNPQIIAVWVFGSAQYGWVTIGSDLDFSVLFEHGPDFEQLLSLQVALQEIHYQNEIDLVCLNSANSILAFEAISGIPIFCRDKDKRAAFVSLVAREYEDEINLLAYAMIA